MSLHLIVSCLSHSIVNKAIWGGITHVQLREKKASTPEILQVGKMLKKILEPKNIPLIINDRIDIALALDADGVHLGQSDRSYCEAGHLLGPKKIIGLTVENSFQVKKANKYFLDYVGIGPIFKTLSKLDAPSPMGLSQLKNLCSLSQHPVIAIGGINTRNASSILAAGAAGIAVISAICNANDPEKTTQEFRKIIEKV